MHPDSDDPGLRWSRILPFSSTRSSRSKLQASVGRVKPVGYGSISSPSHAKTHSGSWHSRFPWASHSAFAAVHERSDTGTSPGVFAYS